MFAFCVTLVPPSDDFSDRFRKFYFMRAGVRGADGRIDGHVAFAFCATLVPPFEKSA